LAGDVGRGEQERRRVLARLEKCLAIKKVTGMEPYHRLGKQQQQ
jgi:hypothetical protein